MRFYGKENQDMFAYYLIGKAGTFLDIGCYNPVMWNNTKALEESGWSGLIFDIEEKWVNAAKHHRTNKSFCVDTTSGEFEKILSDNLADKTVDYISLDVDEASIDTLVNLIKSGVRFNCMTFEHCLFEDPKQKNLSKHILSEEGYTILFEDVLCDLSHDGYKEPQPFEDWWIDTKFFGEDILSIQSNDLYHEECVYKLRKYRL